MRLLTLALLGWFLLQPLQSQAWWQTDWAYRKKVLINTSPTGVDVKQSLSDVAVLVRLHTGNMAFVDLKQDGGDLRFVSADDKVLLKHHIESFDPINELALVWVHLPKLTGGTTAEYVWMYFGNANAAPAEDRKGTYDAAQAAVFHFADKELATTADATGSVTAALTAVARVTDGLVGPAARFDGNARMVVPASPATQTASGGGFTFSAWIKGAGGTLIERKDATRAMTLTLQDGRLAARVTGGAGVQSNAPVAADKWHHVGLTLSDKLTLYVDGAEAGSAALPANALAGEIVIGSGFSGDMDEVQIASVARSAEWFKVAAAGQGTDAKLLTYGEDEQAGSSGSSYFSILLRAVTLDGWVVIGILGVMALISVIVMAGKGLLVARAEKANRLFLEQFSKTGADVLALDRAHPEGGASQARMRHSSLLRIYQIGVKELRTRFDRHTGNDADLNLKPQAIDAIRATLDAGMVRENNRLNSQMVLLTIAISGGPFLGLLGTVVGVMITFAAIAAAGDVNVNSIAPGIAAALVATVAGLGVAIPALFGYNYLASKTKNISSEMRVFADEFVTKLAENYSG